MRSILVVLFLLATTVYSRAQEIVLTNAESLYKVNTFLATHKTLWLSIKLKNNTSSTDWHLQIPPPVLNEVDFLKLNDKALHQNRAIKINGFVLPLQLKTGESRQYYLRIKSDHTLKTPLQIGTLKTIYEQNHRLNVINGCMFGLLLALMIYNLFIYIVIKDTTYLYYFGYTFFTILFQSVWNGYCTDLFSGLNWSLLTISSAIALAFSILFTNGFLRIRSYSPILFKLQNWLLALLLIPALFEIIGFKVIATQFLQTSMYIAFIYWLIAGYLSFKKGFRPATYYLAAFSALIISYVFYDWFHSSISFQLGACLQAVVLSFALAVKLNYLKKETGRMQKAMLDQANVFSKELIIGQETESENIANELNNRIGQQLVLLKNEIFVLKRLSENTSPELFNGITEDIRKTIEEITNVSYSLRPYQMDALGLKLSVERLIEEITADTEIVIDLKIDNIERLLDKEAEMNVYRIIQELLNNLIKHAEAFNCKIYIKATRGSLKLYYCDNGKGYDHRINPTGLGLSGIKERCNLLNASISSSSRMGAGTKVYIKIPIQLNDNNIDKHLDTTINTNDDENNSTYSR